MSEKRFRIIQGYTDRFCHDWQNNQLLNFRETIGLLNEFAEENKELRILVETLKEQNQKFKARLNDLGVEYS